MPISSIVKVSSDNQVMNLLSDVGRDWILSGDRINRWLRAIEVGIFCTQCYGKSECEILECVCKPFRSLGNSNC